MNRPLRERAFAIVGVSAGTIAILACTHDGPKLVRPLPTACASVVGTPDDIARTPRADREAEGLARWARASMTANDADYERVRSDLAAIRAKEPALREVGFRLPWDRALMLGVDDATTTAIKAGTYHAWDCLNAFYGSRSIEPPSDIVPNMVLISFSGEYDYYKLGEIYETLPGIKSSLPNVLMGDGSTICATFVQSHLHYIFWRKAGPCVHGCMGSWSMTHWDSSAAGEVSRMGEWRGGGDARPDWVDRYVNNDACSTPE